MKKFIILLLVVTGLIVANQSKAASASVIVANGVMTNIATILPSPLRVTQIIVTSTNNNTCQMQFIDTYTNWLLYTNLAYTNISSYATNYITTYTNYFGAVNSFTNLALIDVTNTVAQVSNTFPVQLVLSSGTNTSTKVDNVSMLFTRGLWITNSGAGIGTVSINYTQ